MCLRSVGSCLHVGLHSLRVGVTLKVMRPRYFNGYANSRSIYHEREASLCVQCTFTRLCDLCAEVRGIEAQGCNFAENSGTSASSNFERRLLDLRFRFTQLHKGIREALNLLNFPTPYFNISDLLFMRW